MVSSHNSLAVGSLGFWTLMALFLSPIQADVVLMHNGSLMEGETRQEKGAVFVSGPGSELRLLEVDVATVVRSPQEAYQWLRNRHDAGARTASDCLGLAEWCLRQKMWPEASRELLDARRMAPQSERAALIERRLMLLSQEPQEPKIETRDAVQRASAEEPLIEVPAEEVSVDRPIVLPDEGLKHFTRHIQPLLVNNCSTSGCHTAEEGEHFSLDRRLLYGYANARSTQHNLRTILATINIENPAESPLLTAARGPHHDVMPFQGNRREEWLKRLETWVTSVASAQPNRATPTAVVEAAIVQATHEEPMTETIKPNVVQELRPAKVTVGGALTSVKPRDEFDPDIFNRTYRRPEDDLPVEQSGR